MQAGQMCPGVGGQSSIRLLITSFASSLLVSMSDDTTNDKYDYCPFIFELYGRK